MKPEPMPWRGTLRLRDLETAEELTERRAFNSSGMRGVFGAAAAGLAPPTP